VIVTVAHTETASRLGSKVVDTTIAPVQVVVVAGREITATTILDGAGAITKKVNIDESVMTEVIIATVVNMISKVDGDAHAVMVMEERAITIATESAASIIAKPIISAIVRHMSTLLRVQDRMHPVNPRLSPAHMHPVEEALPAG
jgi:hypothetical protein